MTRHWITLAAAAATFGTVATPAAAQDGPPPGWTDPQVPDHRAPHAMPEGPGGRDAYVVPEGPGYPGAPYAHPLPPGGYPDAPMRAPQGYGQWRDARPAGPGAWHGDGRYGYGEGYGYAYQGGAVGAPCGCPGYMVTWVPVPIETRYRYSPPIRHEREVVEEHVVHETVVETKTVPVRSSKYVRTKYVKSAPAKVTKGKVGRATK
jgi:hypothetical protein